MIGLILLFLSAYIVYFRIKIQGDRKQALIDMVKSVNIALAEQIAKNLPERQFNAVIQKIRQNQRDAMTLINDDDKLSCKSGLKKNIIGEEIFNREIALCKKLSKENEGKCGWGECKSCGVIPFLYKLHKGKLLEEPEEIAKIRNEILG